MLFSLKTFVQEEREDSPPAPNLHSPKELVPVESVEKVVGQGLLPHQVVQHSSWNQEASVSTANQPRIWPSQRHCCS